ncbi:MAG: hypothetical protein RL417_1795 [Pseudomonadota bacterium]|jgi:hypothetical protein
MKNRNIIVGACAAVALFGETTYAEFRPQPLVAGMSPREVLTQWGAPLERLERETKREEVWWYPGRAMVSFSSGKVVEWTLGTPPRAAIPLSAAMVSAMEQGTRAAASSAESAPPAGDRASSGGTVSEGDMQEILDAIADGGASSPASAAGLPR